ncbi:hypothetical protein BGZ63DRAFT_125460 [Mariannaea sp. PMI_226]|nr:hypothetical protein BGZ63DRAFT_125460 [Mariannaea sp. PMI_226]
MASLEALWGPATRQLLRVAMTKTSTLVRAKLVAVGQPLHRLQTIGLRTIRVARQPIHPVAVIKQQGRRPRWFSTNSAVQNVNRIAKRFMSSQSQSTCFHRSKLPVSNTSRRVGQLPGRAPFACTLRPNLTGGALPRSAGGYSLGGGARYFSHGPAAPAQVIQNVSQAMRAFFLSGQKLRYDGLGPRGERQYRAVSSLEDEAMKKFSCLPRSAPGAFIDFNISPTLTALSPLAHFSSEVTGIKPEAVAAGVHLNTDGFLDVLSADFGRALKDLAVVYADLRRLAILGDLPVHLEKQNTIRVRFPGVDADTLERLCDDLGVERGIVGEDADFGIAVGVPMALKFPFAPDAPKTFSVQTLEEFVFEEGSSLEDDGFVREAFMDEMADNPWLSDPEGYESMSHPLTSCDRMSDEYEGLEGIYRFLEECDRAEGQVGRL